MAMDTSVIIVSIGILVLYGGVIIYGVWKIRHRG
jgi:hypothetical protein